MLFYTILVALAPLCLAKPFDAEEVMDKLETLQAKVEKLQKENDMLKVTTNELQEHNLEANRATVDTLLLATISAESISISEEPIIFDTAPINPGGHYNTVLGAYTAPFTGYYQFSVAKRSNNGRANFWLLVDEERYFYFDVNIYEGTATINLQLTAGQIVRVENHMATSVRGTDSEGVIQSFFTGYMLYLL